MPRKLFAIGYMSPTLSKKPDGTIENYCKEQGLELVCILRDEQSSSHLNLGDRPAGRKLYGMCRRKRIKNIVAPDLYNLFKDAPDAGRELARWYARRIRVHLLEFGGRPFVIEGDSGWAVARVAEVLGKIERRNIRVRMSSFHARRKVNGYVYAAIPFGWNREGSLLVENGAEQEVIKRIKTLRKEGVSLNAIATRLNKEGVPTKNFGKWYGSTIFGILHNSINHQDDERQEWEMTYEERTTRQVIEMIGGLPEAKESSSQAETRAPQRDVTAAPVANAVPKQILAAEPTKPPLRLVLRKDGDVRVRLKGGGERILDLGDPTLKGPTRRE
jgi:DNA invertase Pin-like site-specific DNA recombinase